MPTNSPRTFKVRAALGSPEPPTASPEALSIGLIGSRRLVPEAVGRGGPDQLQPLTADEAVRVEFANGRRLWMRADDLIAMRGNVESARSADDPPVFTLDLSAPGGSGERGAIAWGIKLLDVFGIDLKEATARLLASRHEAHLLSGQPPGLHRCAIASGTLAPMAAHEPLRSGQRLLVFLHGTASNFKGSFGGLFESADGDDARAAALAREALAKAYGSEVYAFEHKTLTESPIANALQLVGSLPDKAELHLVSHSRGGMVGELLCLANRSRSPDLLGSPDVAPLIDSLFGDAGARRGTPGMPELEDDEAKSLAQAYRQDGDALRKLVRLLDAKQITVRRFVRVACPARGTTLASGRLDRWLSMLQALMPDGVADDLVEFLLAVIKERTDPRVLPGLEAMMPGSPLTRLLNHPALSTSADLSVIAGDLEADEGLSVSSWWSRLKVFVTDWYYGSDHDLVVNTGSMTGGLARPAGGARALEDRGTEVTHFRYFRNVKSVQWLVAGLTRTDAENGGFAPIGLARHEEPARSAGKRPSTFGPRPIVVLIPGVMATRLQREGSEVWLSYLALMQGGMADLTISAQNVSPTSLLDRFYQPLVDHLEPDHRVETFPYDWRRSVVDNAGLLAGRLSAWVDQAEKEGVGLHLVAHSMGGLVARAMIADGGQGAALWERMGKLAGGSRLLMLGTPNHGSLEAMRWLTGYNPTQAKLALIDLVHGTNGLIEIVRRYPGLIELLPWPDQGGVADHWNRSFWATLRSEANESFPLVDSADLARAARTWSSRLCLPLPQPERVCQVAGCAPATVIDHGLVELDESQARKRLAWYATAQGDGTVSWESLRLPGIPTWYAPDTAHDQLCSNADDPRVFEAYVELLANGKTGRLPSAEPQRARGATLRGRFELLQPVVDRLPSADDLNGIGLAGTAQRARRATPMSTPRIQLSVRHADLIHAEHAVLVGHYVGDLIVSAEQALDRRLDGALTRRHLAGRYPGALGTNAVVFNGEAGERPVGAIVLGLGQVGDLTPAKLQASARDAMTDYAQAFVQCADRAARQAPISLSCLLIGTGGAGLAVKNTLECLLRAAVETNRRLERAGYGPQVRIAGIEFIELYEDIAISAALALTSLLKNSELGALTIWPDRTVRSDPAHGGLKRRHFDIDRSWDQRLEIQWDNDRGMLSFSLAGQRARAEQQLSTGQLALADRFVARAVASPRAANDVAKTLFEMLLPIDFKESSPDIAGLVLLLDRHTAQYPWELLEDRWSLNGRPLAIEAGMVRQFKTEDYRPAPVHSTQSSILVVGDPDLEGWPSFMQLRGARAEAEAVRDQFLSVWRTGDVCSLVGAPVDDIVRSLHERPWRVLHLAGHGEHEWQEAPDQPIRSGMVIGRQVFLTAGDVEQMRHVPELVFINCCHLGRTDGSAPAYHRLAANLGAQLIRMGVRAAVVAGWAVDDAAACTFATAFYRELLAGEAFRDAVRAARAETLQRHPEVNTWGAFQCYGDPGWRLVFEEGRSRRTSAPDYVSPRELVADLDNIVTRARSADTFDEEAQRHSIKEAEGRIPEPVRDEWLARADIASAMGFAYAEALLWKEAVDWFDCAVRSPDGACPAKTFEQLLNARVRLAAQTWSDPATERSSQLRKDLCHQIERAIEQFALLPKHAATSERWALMGSAYKRLALIQGQGGGKKKSNASLGKMADAYEHAFRLGGAHTNYLLANWAAATAILSLGKNSTHPAQHADACAQVHELIDARLATAQGAPSPATDFWSLTGQADLYVARILTAASPAVPDAQAARELHARARVRGASRRQRGSVIEHLDFLIDKVKPDDAKRGELLEALKANLES